MNDKRTKSVLITGVSSGIGHGLAAQYLERGGNVYGASRRRPEDLCGHANFHFVSIDLSEFGGAHAKLLALVDDVTRFDLVVLNAGVLGKFGDIGDAEFGDLKHTLDVNLWANKVVLDTLYGAGIVLDQVVTISSGAAVNGNRGWSGYSISKAALNMLTLLYARERPDTHFCAFAPGLVDTEIQDVLEKIPADDRYPTLANINAKRGTPEFPTGEELAPRLAETIARLPGLVESGAFADIRKLPPTT